MKYPGFYTPILLLILCLPADAGETANVTLFFSPHGGCEATIINAINAADSEILVAAYSFSSKPIARALYTATKRGIPVQVILDRKQPTIHYSMANDLVINGLAVRVDRREPLMHMKTIIIDGKILISGSYNFTASAEHRNVEILTIIISEKIAAQATANWRKHWQHSDTLYPKSKFQTQKGKKTVTRQCTQGPCPLKPTQIISRRIYRRKIQWSN